ncbi:Mrp/NBP35 family ATP-binding protein [Methanomassiliicoccus luminyensis]|uniref:Mrp/NBP35 family ATP-binding protein n=1 Tax=Methanomassiliicoccus luminyensis TaxID=1080712 RepID=UPI0003607419|nr:Mrp/NBP35 family ATP-binding protein [Methanomassiliicoccus luminyensis]
MQGDINVVTAKPEDVKLIRKLSKIKHTIVVMSGKGGVGKSTVTVNLAVGLAMRGFEVGILDADIHGPNIPKMLKIEDAQLVADDEGIYPAIVPPHLKVMSMAFLSPNRDQPIIWRGPMKMGAIRKFIEDVYWGELDYLIVDLPPGTGDEPLTIAQLIPSADGSIIVTTPQDVALLDSRKSVVFSADLKLPVIGIVENMAGLVCPHCNKEIDLFKIGGGEKAAKELDVPFLGRVPIDPDVVNTGDEGLPIVAANPDSPAAKAFNGIIDKVVESIEGNGGKKKD